MTDVKCLDCGHNFTVILPSIKNIELTCPKCGGKNIEEVGND